MNAFRPETVRSSDNVELDQEDPRDPGVVQLHEAIVREHAEPRDGYEPAPVWLFFFYLTIMGIGGWYLGMYSGAFSRDIYQERPSQWMALAPNATGPTALDPMKLGKRVYARCAACHQADGAGLAGTYPPLAGSPWVQGRPEVLAGILLRGISGPLEVHGEVYNEEMPAWSALADRDLGAVMTYVRGSWGNDAPPVDPAFVALVRDYLSEQRGHWTEQELITFREHVNSGGILFDVSAGESDSSTPSKNKGEGDE